MLCLAAAAGLAPAQVLIGQTSSFSGPVAAGVKEGTDGAKLYLEAVNDRGGVNGQKIELLSLDDKFDPKLAADNAAELARKGVVALFFNRGTPQSQAILPVLDKYRLPLIAPSTGAMLLHKPVHPWVFNVRTTYHREAERAVRHLHLTGMTRIALLQADDSFGDDGAAGAKAGFDALKLQPVLHEKYSRTKPDFAPLGPKLVQAQAQAVVFVGSGTHVVDGVKAIRAAGSTATVVTLSNNAASGFIKALGDQARGVVVSQVFPFERSVASPLVKEMLDLLATRRKGEEATPAMLEGFAAAKVLVEALKRAGKDPTAERIKTALEGFKRVDIGGLEISFSPTDHTGLDYADLSIIGIDGKFHR
ncbi:MAG: ABC transporter substrate-binding protein [Proteobacteria bacterium]|nr:ABC transporter substrate-binding protein [Pseudomonadota bacterium]